MGYLTNDTQPERTALAWSRSSLALFAATIWVCRLAFIGESLLAIIILLICGALMLGHLYLANKRKLALSAGIDASIGSAIDNALLVAQVIILGLAALVL